MPVPLKLGVSFTQVEINAMKAAAQVIIDTVQSKMIINLSTKDREELSKVADKRELYIHRSIQEYAVMYPQFNPLAYPVADATNDLHTFSNLGDVLIKIAEATEITEEMKMVAGHFDFVFMTKQYEMAQTNLDQNVPGAQIVYDGLKGAFEGQGVIKNNTPPTPPVNP